MNSSLFVLRFVCFYCLMVGCQATSVQKPDSILPTKIGGGCDGCELMYIDMPAQMDHIDTSQGWSTGNQKLVITGRVLSVDGHTPASDVILYYWHTDDEGLYTFDGKGDTKAGKHGSLRGWVKTNAAGQYTIYTSRPVPYPSGEMAAHIHLSIKEPDLANEYYVDEINFDDDQFLLPQFTKNPPEKRGGSGVVRVLLDGDAQLAEHDIILGLNIPFYPRSVAKSPKSGLSIGEDQPSFMPFHVYGPDKGKNVCPVCKYGRFLGLIFFAGKSMTWNEITDWLNFLEQESIKMGKELKVYVVCTEEAGGNREKTIKKLEELGQKLGLKHLALTIVPSFHDTVSEIDLSRIDPHRENTIVLFKHRRIYDKFIDMKANAHSFSKISTALDDVNKDWFHLPEPAHD
ncbi:MAG: hypothetical protein KDC49_22855 [Saprospiraceae bacterium]|nr:hypothetical protein [Saprospiraceae bacterium]